MHPARIACAVAFALAGCEGGDSTQIIVVPEQDGAGGTIAPRAGADATAAVNTTAADTAANDTAANDTAANDTAANDAAANDAGRHEVSAEDTQDDTSDAGPVEAIDAGAADVDLTPVTCPGPLPPQAGKSYGYVPQPDTSKCKSPPPAFFKGAAPPPQTLAVEVGVISAMGVFKPYIDKQWTPMVHGAQGGFHIWSSLRFPATKFSDPMLKVQTEMLLYDGCKVVGFSPYPVTYPKKWLAEYIVGSTYNPGVTVQFGTLGWGVVNSGSSADFCNRWFDLRVSVRVMGTDDWGQSTVRIRTYDTKPAQ